MPSQPGAGHSFPLLLLGPFVQAIGGCFPPPYARGSEKLDSAVSMLCTSLMYCMNCHVTKLSLLPLLLITGHRDRCSQHCMQAAVHWEMPLVLDCVKAPSEMPGVPSGSYGFKIEVDKVGHCLLSAGADFVPPSSTAYQI